MWSFRTKYCYCFPPLFLGQIQTQALTLYFHTSIVLCGRGEGGGSESPNTYGLYWSAISLQLLLYINHISVPVSKSIMSNKFWKIIDVARIWRTTNGQKVLIIYTRVSVKIYGI